MLTNVKLGIMNVTRKHIAPTQMALTHVNVATAGGETGMLAKVKRKYTCISIVFSDNCANYSDMFLAQGK